MAVKRKTGAGAPAFTGAQLLTFDRYRERRDLTPPRRGGKKEGTPKAPPQGDINQISFMSRAQGHRIISGGLALHYIG